MEAGRLRRQCPGLGRVPVNFTYRRWLQPRRREAPHQGVRLTRSKRMAGFVDREISDRDCAWVLGCGACSTAVGLVGAESCADEDCLDETPTATPMIKTTSADKVQERRSESSRPCMAAIVGLRWIPALRPGSQFPGITSKTASALRLPSTGWLSRAYRLGRAGCSDRLLPEEVHGRLIQTGPQLEAFVGASDVANHNLHTANDRLDADARSS